MTTDNIINLIAAIIVGGGTLSLAVMTWKSIRQTRAIQRMERRERLLREIIDWSTESINCEYLPDTSIFKSRNFKEASILLFVDIDKLQAMFKKLQSMSDYMVRIVAIFKKEELQKASEQFVNGLGEHVELIGKYKDIVSNLQSSDKLTKLTDDVREIDTHKLLLDKSAERVIEEATKIKTRDIG